MKDEFDNLDSIDTLAAKAILQKLEQGDPTDGNVRLAIDYLKFKGFTGVSAQNAEKVDHPVASIPNALPYDTLEDFMTQ